MTISKDVILRAAQGDVPSFEIIFRAYAEYVFNIILRIVQSREDAEDLTQEVFTMIYRKLNTFRFKSGFKTWVYRIAVNRAVSHARKHAKAGRKAAAPDHAVDSMSSGNTAEEDIDKKTARRLITTLLRGLTPEQRACVVLRNIEGLRYAEIAQVLGINISAVRSRLKRAREKLMKLRKEATHDDM